PPSASTVSLHDALPIFACRRDATEPDRRHGRRSLVRPRWALAESGMQRDTVSGAGAGAPTAEPRTRPRCLRRSNWEAVSQAVVDGVWEAVPVDRVGYVIIFVSDLTAAVAFYRAVLGLPFKRAHV